VLVCSHSFKMPNHEHSPHGTHDRLSQEGGGGGGQVVGTGTHRYQLAGPTLQRLAALHTTVLTPREPPVND
jgi:hypothetical protein